MTHFVTPFHASVESIRIPTFNLHAMLFPFFFSSFVELLKNYLAQVLHFYLFSSGFCVVNVIKIAFS